MDFFWLGHIRLVVCHNRHCWTFKFHFLSICRLRCYTLLIFQWISNVFVFVYHKDRETHRPWEILFIITHTICVPNLFFFSVHSPLFRLLAVCTSCVRLFWNFFIKQFPLRLTSTCYQFKQVVWFSSLFYLPPSLSITLSVSRSLARYLFIIPSFIHRNIFGKFGIVTRFWFSQHY